MVAAALAIISSDDWIQRQEEGSDWSAANIPCVALFFFQVTGDHLFQKVRNFTWHLLDPNGSPGQHDKAQ